MSKRHKICIVTSSRSEYGLLRPIIDEVRAYDELELQLVVGGAHLREEHGYTVENIREDGYAIADYLDYLLLGERAVDLAKSMGICMSQCAEVFAALKPDLLVVLGDRYELIPITGAALLLHLPIAHLSGGDVTLGAIDNQVRNMVTMVANLHFPGCEASAENIRRMRGENRYIYNVGEPGLENLKNAKLMTRMELAESLRIDANKPWIVVTLHSETFAPLAQSKRMAAKMMKALKKQDAEIIITYANADEGGAELNRYYEKCAQIYENIHIWKSLGQLRYNSVMKEAWCVVGNSSSGIVEAPFLGVPVVNIGDRQKGRYLSPCVINVPQYEGNEIEDALERVRDIPRVPDYYFGDGQVSKKVVEHIKEYLNTAC